MKLSGLSFGRGREDRPRGAPALGQDRRVGPLWWLFGLVCFLVAIPPFPSVINVLLDPSWEGVIDYLSRTNTPIGDRHFFTYGPWGHVYRTAYYGQALWGFWVFRIMETAFLSVALVWVVKSHSGLLRYMAGAGVVLGILLTRDEMTMILVGVLGMWLGNRKAGWALRLMVIGFLAALCLVKFTFALIAVAGLVAAFLGHSMSGRSRTGGAIIAVFAIAFGLFWWMSGNSLAGIPQWVNVSAQLATGYPDAMSLPAPTSISVVATAASVVLLIAVLGILWTSRSLVAAVSSILATGSLGFFAWKHGIIRAPGHTFLFFGVVPSVTAVILVAWQNPGRRPLQWARTTLMVAGLASSLIGLILIGPGSVSGLFARLQTRTESVLALALKYKDLKGAASATLAVQRDQFGFTDERILASTSLDVLGYEQAYALLSDVAYQPRPIFQNYTVYTPGLEALNRDFFGSSDAPDVLLIKVQAIDDHIEMLHDGSSYLAALLDYEPIGSDRKFLIMKRKQNTGNQPDAQVVVDEDFAVGSWVELPATGGRHFDRLHVDLEMTLGDHLRAFLYKPRPCFMDLRLSDGSIVTRRLNPRAAPSGFLVSPWIETTKEFLTASLGTTDSRQAVAFLVRGDGGDLTASNVDSARLRLERIPIPELQADPER